MRRGDGDGGGTRPTELAGCFIGSASLLMSKNQGIVLNRQPNLWLICVRGESHVSPIDYDIPILQKECESWARNCHGKQAKRRNAAK
jgi:hypothetical protein